MEAILPRHQEPLRIFGGLLNILWVLLHNGLQLIQNDRLLQIVL